MGENMTTQVKVVSIGIDLASYGGDYLRARNTGVAIAWEKDTGIKVVPILDNVLNPATAFARYREGNMKLKKKVSKNDFLEKYFSYESAVFKKLEELGGTLNICGRPNTWRG